MFSSPYHPSIGKTETKKISKFPCMLLLAFQEILNLSILKKNINKKNKNKLLLLLPVS